MEGPPTIHVLTPLYRIHLVPTLIHYLEPMGIEWYPIMTPKERPEFTDPNWLSMTFPHHHTWIHPITVPDLQPSEKCQMKFNHFAEQHPLHDEDYYAFMCDDNMYEPGFFDVIRQQTAKIIVCSAYRGDTVPGDGAAPHATSPLVPTSIQDMRPCNIDLCQYLVRGEVLRAQRFNPTSGVGDGEYAAALKTCYPNDIVVIPTLFVLFNYFQPGRYTRVERFSKPSWALPEVIPT